MMKKKWIGWLGFIFLIPSLLFNFYFYNRLLKSESEAGGVKVVKVIDGDTIEVENNQTILLSSVDAPELEFCLGKEAKKMLEELVLDKRVRLAELTKDTYNRMMALVYLGDELINKTMLGEGMGRYDSTYTSVDQELVTEANTARGKKSGVYSPLCTQTETPSPKCTIKGNIDKHYREKIYHFPGCGGYSNVIVEKDRGEDWFCTEKEARDKGYKKSEQCFKDLK